MDNKNKKIIRRRGFEDASKRIVPCRHPGHKPPDMLVIPAGKVYRHICPGCGMEIELHSNSPTLCV